MSKFVGGLLGVYYSKGTTIFMYTNTDSTDANGRPYFASCMALPLFLLGSAAHNVRRDFLYFCWHVCKNSSIISFVFTGRVCLKSLWY